MVSLTAIAYILICVSSTLPDHTKERGRQERSTAHSFAIQGCWCRISFFFVVVWCKWSATCRGFYIDLRDFLATSCVLWRDCMNLVYVICVYNLYLLQHKICHFCLFGFFFFYKMHAYVCMCKSTHMNIHANVDITDITIIISMTTIIIITMIFISTITVIITIIIITIILCCNEQSHSTAAANDTCETNCVVMLLRLCNMGVAWA